MRKNGKSPSVRDYVRFVPELLAVRDARHPMDKWVDITRYLGCYVEHQSQRDALEKWVIAHSERGWPPVPPVENSIRHRDASEVIDFFVGRDGIACAVLSTDGSPKTVGKFMVSSFNSPVHADHLIIKFPGGVKPANPYAPHQAKYARFEKFVDGETVFLFVSRCKPLGGYLSKRATTMARMVLDDCFSRGIIGIGGVFKKSLQTGRYDKYMPVVPAVPAPPAPPIDRVRRPNDLDVLTTSVKSKPRYKLVQGKPLLID